MIYKDARDREIISQYNGFNHKELAAKYNMSESYIRAIINRHKKETTHLINIGMCSFLNFIY